MVLPVFPLIIGIFLGVKNILAIFSDILLHHITIIRACQGMTVPFCNGLLQHFDPSTGCSSNATPRRETAKFSILLIFKQNISNFNVIKCAIIKLYLQMFSILHRTSSLLKLLCCGLFMLSLILKPYLNRPRRHAQFIGQVLSTFSIWERVLCIEELQDADLSRCCSFPFGLDFLLLQGSVKCGFHQSCCNSECLKAYRSWSTT